MLLFLLRRGALQCLQVVTCEAGKAEVPQPLKVRCLVFKPHVHQADFVELLLERRAPAIRSEESNFESGWSFPMDGMVTKLATPMK